MSDDNTQLIEQFSDPRKLAVGVSAYLTDLIGSEILTEPVANIVAKFKAEFPEQEIEELLDGLSRGYGRCSLERVIWSTKIALVKVIDALDHGTQLSVKEIAKRLKVREKDVLAEVLSPSGSKLVNDCLVAHCSQRVGEIYLAMLAAAKGGNAKSAELILGRFDPQHRGGVDPTARDQGPDFNRMSEDELRMWVINQKKLLGEPCDDEYTRPSDDEPVSNTGTGNAASEPAIAADPGR